MNVQFADALGMVTASERDDCSAMRAQIYLAGLCSGSPIETYTSVGPAVTTVVAVCHIEMHVQGNLSTPFQACSYELLVTVFHKNRGP